MKYLPLILALFSSTTTVAGDKIGNGGGLWACKSGGELIHAQLVDRFETRVEFFLPLKEFGESTVEAIFADRVSFLKKDLPQLFSEWEEHFEFVRRNLDLVEGELREIDDSLYRVSPSPATCPDGKWSYVQFANFTTDGRLLVQADLWRSPRILPADKAALLVHEGIYRWFRNRFKDENSVRARRFTGLIFADIEAVEMHRRMMELLPELSPSPPPADGIDDSLGFFLAAKSSQPGVQAVMHIADAPYGQNVGTGNFSSACRVPPGAGGAAADLFCILEIEELDLYFHDIGIRVHVPSDACSYLREKPYSYYSHEPGNGPARVEYEVLANGQIRDVLNSSNGLPLCRFDYGNVNGPNCCIGKYQRVVRTHHGDGSSTVATSEEDWGGSVSGCLAGPAMDFGLLDPKGFPLSTISYVRGTGVAKTYPIMSGLARAETHNVYGSNFYNPKDHDGGRPLALRKPRYLQPKDQYLPNDTYNFECLDGSERVTARIRLMVREWNSSMEEGGDPDRSGPDSDFPDLEINDRLDWKDIGEAFPGDRA